MNKYEKRAQTERKSAIKASTRLWTAGIALGVVVLLIVGLSSSAPSGFYSKGAIGIAILLLVVRQISRRVRQEAPKSARPDPESTLHLE